MIILLGFLGEKSLSLSDVREKATSVSRQGSHRCLIHSRPGSLRRRVCQRRNRLQELYPLGGNPKEAGSFSILKNHLPNSALVSPQKSAPLLSQEQQNLLSRVRLFNLFKGKKQRGVRQKDSLRNAWRTRWFCLLPYIGSPLPAWLTLNGCRERFENRKRKAVLATSRLDFPSRSEYIYKFIKSSQSPPGEKQKSDECLQICPCARLSPPAPPRVSLSVIRCL